MDTKVEAFTATLSIRHGINIKEICIFCLKFGFFFFNLKLFRHFSAHIVPLGCITTPADIFYPLVVRCRRAGGSAWECVFLNERASEHVSERAPCEQCVGGGDCGWVRVYSPREGGEQKAARGAVTDRGERKTSRWCQYQLCTTPGLQYGVLCILAN